MVAISLAGIVGTLATESPLGGAAAVAAVSGLYGYEETQDANEAAKQALIAGVTDYVGGIVIGAVASPIIGRVKIWWVGKTARSTGLGAIGERRWAFSKNSPFSGSFSKAIKGKLSSDEMGVMEGIAKQHAGVDKFIYESPNGNQFYPGEIHYAATKGQVRRGVAYEEIQHAFDHQIDQDIIIVASRSTADNLIVHAGVARRLAQNQLLPTTAEENILLYRLASRLESRGASLHTLEILRAILLIQIQIRLNR